MTDVCKFDVKPAQFTSFPTATNAALTPEGRALRVASPADHSLSHDSEKLFFDMRNRSRPLPATIAPSVLRFQKKCAHTSCCIYVVNIGMRSL
jgi:hypothetical protein